MKPLKILHVIGQEPEKTGSGVYLQAVIKESEKYGFSNYMVAGVPENTVPELNEIDPSNCSYVFFESNQLNFPVTGMSDVMPYKSSLFKSLKGNRLTAYKKAFGKVLEKAVKRYNPDIIHTHHLFVLTALARKLFPNLPIVTTCHGTDLRQYNNCLHLRSFVKKYCRRLDRIIALTADQKEEILRIYDVPPEKIFIAGGGYDETIFSRERKSLKWPVQILYAGKFNRSKGVPWLLKSLMKITHHDWHLHMAGSGKGSEFKDCMDLVEKMGDQVTVHGYVTHRQLSALMKQAHIQVLPSFFEGLPLVLFEGLASGCRIITTNLSGFDEIFGRAKKDTISLIQLPVMETIDQPFKKDETMLEKALSDSILNMMAAVKRSPNFSDAHAQKIAVEYTWKRIFHRIVSVYHEAVNHSFTK